MTGTNTLAEESQEELTSQIKSVLDDVVMRPHYKPRVVCRGDHWFVTISVSPRYRGEIAMQVGLPERVDSAIDALKGIGVVVEREDVANADPDHVRWLMVATTADALDAGRTRRRQWYTLGRGRHGAC